MITVHPTYTNQVIIEQDGKEYAIYQLDGELWLSLIKNGSVEMGYTWMINLYDIIRITSQEITIKEWLQEV